jgi:KDO2-lipid IV(A) lauroyltransferase
VQVFQNGALNYWDTFAIPHVGRDELLALVDVHGAEHIDNALRLGKGAILASAHLGSIGLVGQIMPALGHPITGLLEPIQPPELFDFFTRQRQGPDFHLYPVGARGLRAMVQALRDNQVVGLITDREFGGASVEVSFFDYPTLFAEGTAALSLRTGAPIIIGVCARRARGRFDAWIEPLPPVLMGDDQKANVRAQTQAIATRLQYYVASHPAQWTVFQRRWPG